MVLPYEHYAGVYKRIRFDFDKGDFAPYTLHSCRYRGLTYYYVA